ncbi:MAG: PIG-L family deacetylase [Halothiobacillaceae bacterium]|nr:PIG-L family deacetylase [Halothiobacillaceae bacterium]
MNRRLRWKNVYRMMFGIYEKIEPIINYSVAKEPLPRAQRVVVLAPHIDDETIGCGGVIAKHVAEGDRVAVLTFADCTPARIAEGEAAGRILGVQRQAFLPYPSKSLLDQADLPARLAAFLDEEKPDLVYTPGLFDRHVDHLSVNLLLARHSSAHRPGYMVYAYEVWNTLTPNVAIDISRHRQQKADALACFTSQNAANNWVDAGMSLSRYRGITTGAGEYAEAFLRMSAARHIELMQHAFTHL